VSVEVVQTPADKRRSAEIVRRILRVLWFVILAIFLGYIGLALYFAIDIHFKPNVQASSIDKVTQASTVMILNGLFWITVCWFTFGRKSKKRPDPDSREADARQKPSVD
jgi:hypothetical protein